MSCGCHACQPQAAAPAARRSAISCSDVEGRGLSPPAREPPRARSRALGLGAGIAAPVPTPRRARRIPELREVMSALSGAMVRKQASRALFGRLGLGRSSGLPTPFPFPEPDPCALLSPDAQPQPPVTFGPDDLRAHVPGLTNIHLGRSETWGKWVSPSGDDELKAYVPADFEANLDNDEFRELVWKHWLDEKAMTWDEAAARLTFEQERVRGMYWDSKNSGYYYQAMLHAIVTAYSFASKALSIEEANEACNITHRELRDYLMNELDLRLYTPPHKKCATYDITLSVDAVGRLSVSSRSSDCERKDCAGATNYGGRIEVCDEFKVNAAVADYMMYWSHRLMAYFLECGNPQHGILAYFCARSALAEIVHIAQMLVHEAVHDNRFTTAGDHCKANCCHNLAGWSFQQRCTAHLGLVRPISPVGADEDRSPDPWLHEAWDFVRGRAGAGGECGGMTVGGLHCGTFSRERPLQLRWAVPHDCAAETAGGVVNWDRTDGDCISAPAANVDSIRQSADQFVIAAPDWQPA